jgi:hypothetical protein
MDLPKFFPLSLAVMGLAVVVDANATNVAAQDGNKPHYYRVLADTLNVRTCRDDQSPSINCNPSFVVNRNDQLIGFERSGDWLHVYRDGKGGGWASLDYLRRGGAYFPDVPGGRTGIGGISCSTLEIACMDTYGSTDRQNVAKCRKEVLCGEASG